MQNYFEVETDYLRGVITGKIQFRKCPQCDNEGIEIQAYGDDGNPCAPTAPDAFRYPCRACIGLGFVEIPS
jgi:hypothetical protein